MSHVTISEVIDAVAKTYRVSMADMKTRSKPRLMGDEARTVCFMLVGKHTEALMGEMLRLFSIDNTGRNIHSVNREVAGYLGLLERDPWRALLVERIEQHLDLIHEARTAATRHETTAVLPAGARVSNVEALLIRDIEDMSVKWWAANDAQFRRAYIEAAE